MTEWCGDEDAIGELESPEESMRVFDGIPSEVFVKALRWRLQNDAVAKQNLSKLYRAWRGQSGDKLMKIVRSEIPEEVCAAMFGARNRLWTPRVAELATSQRRTLICVGAGHLHGPANLRELLEKQCGLSCVRIEP